MTPTSLDWRDFMEKLRDADATKVKLFDDGDFSVDDARYRMNPMTDAERATVHRDHRGLLDAAAGKIVDLVMAGKATKVAP